MIRVYLAQKQLWNKKSGLPMIDNLTPLVHKRIEKQIDKASLKKIRPSSAGNQVNVKEMIK